jgi:hypothetical protein
MEGIRRRASRTARVAVAVVAAAAVVPVLTASAAERAPGTGKPPAGSGINTAAAFANPACVKDAGPYGRMGLVTVDIGPVCLPEWKGGDNGGATYQGVTEDTIEVVALVPNEQQSAELLQKPVNYATTGTPGTVQDAISDALAGYEHAFGGKYTYGRDIELEFVVSSGDDEVAQRADALAVKDRKPFAVLDHGVRNLPVFDSEMVAAKIPVFSLYVTVDETLEQAPYRWGQQDPVAGSLNAAEFIGKQLAGRKAAYAGDDAMHASKRKLGLVRSDVIDTDYFNDVLAEYDAQIAPDATFSYPGSSGGTGDPAVAQEYAPVAVSKLKEAGVTTVVLLADSAMVTAMLKQATEQGYRPEWVYAGSQNIDFPLLGRTYDQEQWAHAFGISNVWPGSPNAPTTVPNVVQWYWGPGKGTYQITYSNAISWLVTGIMYAGPKLTPQTLKQGFFAIPAAGGSAAFDPTLANQGARSGYGRTNGLPYEEYTRGNKDFTPTWWDPDTVGPPSLGFPGGQGALWYLDDAKRYYAGTWPTKKMTFFDESNSIYQFDAPAEPPDVLPCAGCPSETGVGEPGASTA